MVYQNISLAGKRFTPSISAAEAVSSSPGKEENDLFIEVESGSHLIEPPEKLQ